MKFIANSLALSSTARMLQKVINTKNPLPILSNILCEVKQLKDGYFLTMSAYDGEVYLSRTIMLEEAEGEQTFCAEAHYLSDGLSQLSSQPLTIEVDKDNNQLTLKHESGETFFPLSDEAEYPIVPTEDMPEYLTLDKTLILNALKRSLWTAAKDDLRPQMNGACIALADGCVDIVCSDGHSLVLTSKAMPNIDQQRCGSFVIPKKPATLLLSMLPMSDEVDDVFMDWNDQWAKIENGNFQMRFRLPEQKYPNYRSVIRSSSPLTASVNVSALTAAVKNVLPFSNSGTQLVRLFFSGNDLTVNAEDFDFSRGATDRIGIEYHGDDLSIGCGGNRLLSILSKLVEPTVTIGLMDPSRPILFDDKEGDAEITMLLMPMLVNE